MNPLPPEVQRLLIVAKATKRLTVHLEIVHDTCCQLLNALEVLFPTLLIDKNTISLGAALHDAGKIIHPNELYGPGARHEEDGPVFLIDHGFDPTIARFSRTHGKWDSEELNLEDLLVALSDTIWKGARIDALESKVVKAISDETKSEIWDVFYRLDEALTVIAGKAEERLALQAKV